MNESSTSEYEQEEYEHSQLENVDEDQADDSEDQDDDLSQLSCLLKQTQEQTFTNVRSQQQQQLAYTQELPKIDEDIEEDEEIDENPNAKTHATSSVHLSNLKKHLATMSRPAPFIQMTKTARLRFNKLNQVKQSSAGAENNPSKRQTKSLVKENISSESAIKQRGKLPIKSTLTAPTTSTIAKSTHLPTNEHVFKFMGANRKPAPANITLNTQNSSSKPVASLKNSVAPPNSGTKSHTVLTTVNFHSNTFNFNYKS